MACFGREHYVKLAKELGLEGDEGEKFVSELYNEELLGLEQQARIKRVTARAESYGDIDKVPGDGNCMFTCISRALDQFRTDISVDMRTSSAVRDSIMNYIVGNSDEYSHAFCEDETFDNYVTRLRQNGQYGDNHILNAAANHYQLSFFIVMESSDILIFPDNGIVKGTVYLCYTGNHYDRIVA